MKKFFFLLCGFAAVALTSCDSSEKQAKQFAENFATAVARGDTAAIARMYPAAAGADSLALAFEADSLTVEFNEAGDTIRFRFAPDVTMTAVKDAQDSIRVVSSKGIFAYTPERLKFAKGTGWYDEALDDLANAERLSDTLFVETLTQQVAAKFLTEMKSKVKVTRTDVSNTSEMGRYKFTVVVSNQSDKEVGGNDYTVRAAIYSIYHMGVEIGEDLTSTRTLTGQPIPAKGTTTYSWVEAAPMQGNDLRATLTYNPSVENVLADYQPTGTEYADYLSTK
ncbi:MAG: hypothetical protein J6M53_01800 [Bacteroidaceae bacterium]|nr:hypothetical protein [Bacteroidaceae bacterium]